MPSAGRTSMPTSAPEMPVTLTDPVAFFCAVSTVAMVSPPIRAATCAALAAADDSNSATEAAKIERKFIVKLPVFRWSSQDQHSGYRRRGETDAANQK